jgi:hypothetical protein
VPAFFNIILSALLSDRPLRLDMIHRGRFKLICRKYTAADRRFIVTLFLKKCDIEKISNYGVRGGQK